MPAGVEMGDFVSSGFQLCFQIEDLGGSNLGDHLVGDAGPNHLIGHAGDDFLDGAAGSDYIDAGPGGDSCLNGETVLDCE